MHAFAERRYVHVRCTYSRHVQHAPSALHQQAANKMAHLLRTLRPSIKPANPQLPSGSSDRQHPHGYVVQDSFALAPQVVDTSSGNGGWSAFLLRGMQQYQQQGHPQRHDSDPASDLQRLAPANQPAAAAPPASPATILDASSQLAFARHLSTASNGCAPLGSRMESLSWLVFMSGQQQARTITGPPADPSSWLETAEKLALLEQVYVLGQAVADLGVADGVYAAGAGGGAASNGQRAVAALDFAALLGKYLNQVRVF